MESNTTENNNRLDWNIREYNTTIPIRIEDKRITEPVGR